MSSASRPTAARRASAADGGSRKSRRRSEQKERREEGGSPPRGLRGSARDRGRARGGGAEGPRLRGGAQGLSVGAGPVRRRSDGEGPLDGRDRLLAAPPDRGGQVE